MARRGFAPPKAEPRKRVDIASTIQLINAIAKSGESMSAKDADKDPPANSPRMSGFNNLGGISGRKR